MKAMIQAINSTVKILAENGLVCPAESRKNTYTMACWLLAKYKRVAHLKKDAVIDNIHFLREKLPELREYCKQL